MFPEGNPSPATRTADGESRVDHWLELPGPPHDAWVEASGRLRITSQAGTTLVDPDGTPHFESCAQSPPAEK